MSLLKEKNIFSGEITTVVGIVVAFRHVASRRVWVTRASNWSSAQAPARPPSIDDTVDAREDVPGCVPVALVVGAEEENEIVSE